MDARLSIDDIARMMKPPPTTAIYSSRRIRAYGTVLYLTDQEYAALKPHMERYGIEEVTD